MADRIPHDVMATELEKMVYGETCWLADFSQGPKKRPESDIEQKRVERDVLRQAASDYRAAAERGVA